jgi:shikimate kinase
LPTNWDGSSKTPTSSLAIDSAARFPKCSPFVLATGGGIVTREENWTELRRLGKVVYIDVPTDILVARLAVSKKRRPLLETEDPEAKIRELLESRRSLYEQADLRVVIEHEEIPAAATKIREALA